MFIRTTLFSLFLLSHGFAAISAETGRDPTRFQADIDSFETNDNSSPPRQIKVVFVGSSSIRMWNLQKSFPGMEFLNRGFGGSEIADSTHYFNELIGKHHPRLVVFYAGDNDVAAGNTAEQVHADFKEFVETFKAELPDASLAYIAIKPSVARWSMADTMQKANTLIAADCEADDQLTFIDVWPVMLGDDGQPRPDIFLGDGLHMNDKGYEMWAELLQPILKK
ncbi:SGNH/GDSL hydrolase family protein [Bythopirellula polymerisocia]|uniref:GDSL-like Lipase/Acylhydrolase n=1 Tax=Bythopirellula polymerisocia TaxID=2528003 RepID=A0A5C6D1X9_9BACT|nr:SGNH/GDSL hydrolase family protein [Bythopirellula polymerisocia]TWU29657.1 GDSL-like Lipase/Acylhydrolase [Bythopirellula polymerisocia]